MFTIGLNGLQNVPTQVLHKEFSLTVESKQRFNAIGESAHHRAVSQIASFQFLSGYILFFTIGLIELPNVPEQILHVSNLLTQKKCLICEINSHITKQFHR